MCFNFYHKWRSQTGKIAYVKSEGFECYLFGQNGSGVSCLWCITDQVCLGQNGFFWHPWVVWKVLEARLGLWAFRTCTGCKSYDLVKRHLEPKWSSVGAFNTWLALIWHFTKPFSQAVALGSTQKHTKTWNSPQSKIS